MADFAAYDWLIGLNLGARRRELTPSSSCGEAAERLAEK